MASMGACVFCKLEEDYRAIAEILSGDTSASVLEQAFLFGKVDKGVVDYWFPNIPSFLETTL
ncbi:hypothetical protein V1512DRAFT_244606 [Lipomyces arxii]|uniref:uncharacterized protein n=1 Tax=Lipomyces arxii TaxID=56418 RepID=UPI0034CF0D7B